MSEPEPIYTAREVAAQLGLGAAMLRRYASTYEAVSGDEITVHKRDGRLFTETQVKALSRARELVMRTNTDVDTAMRQALEQPLASAPVALAQSSALTAESLIQALTAAQTAANEPLLSELKGIRETLERLLDKPETTSEFPKSNVAHGRLVRAALWLEGLLGRR
jgi:hypothetical protein